jgi:hypothetical protein
MLSSLNHGAFYSTQLAPLNRCLARFYPGVDSCHDRRFGGKAAWTKMYWRWLSEQRFDFPHQQLAFEEMQKRVLEAQARVGRLEAALTEAVDAWCFAPLVRNLQVLRGIRLVSAATLVAEVGDLTRLTIPSN